MIRNIRLAIIFAQYYYNFQETLKNHRKLKI